ncbi:MAG: triose-phosphate isomerase [Campylobacterota bacterium]|nr:triose-phosphate isomerase [Campylobacterota bacterium]
MILAANFKSNLTRAKTTAYLETVEAYCVDNNISDEVIVFPPASALQERTLHVSIGAQNAFGVANGAFTGELALDQLQEFGIKTVLIGHSERRHVIGESQELIAEKFAYYKEQGFQIVYCIGEPIEVREEGNKALLAYLDAQYKGIDLSYKNLVVAYEPVWAIGTGLTPTLEDVELIHTAIREDTEAPLLYGGSVKANNAKSFLALDNVDGILVGSGALNPDDFCSMIRDAHSLK